MLIFFMIYTFDMPITFDFNDYNCYISSNWEKVIWQFDALVKIISFFEASLALDPYFQVRMDVLPSGVEL